MRLIRPVVCALLVALLAGCSTGTDWSEPRPAPSPVGALGSGFLAPSASPTPASTVTPAPGSWDDVHPGAGYRVVLLTAGDDAATTTLAAAVRDWAAAEDADLRTVASDGDHVQAVVDAMNLDPDLIVTAGNDLIDPLALVTPSHLDRQFLVAGAELAEPTANVTAVNWAGAAFRGEGLGSSSGYDPATFTTARCATAIRAGVAAVLTGLTGIVVEVS